jgi:hypothetical protein
MRLNLPRSLIAMTTVQTNVRVLAGDKPLVRAIAARLRAEPRFRDRLVTLLDEEQTPALHERIEKLEAQVDWLMSDAGETRTGVRAHLLPGSAMFRPEAANGGSHSPG